jgi:hypothetical protein
MRLLDLEPAFVKCESELMSRDVQSIQEADGVRFLCPVCWEKNKGPIGTHAVICWKPTVPLSRPPGPGRWGLEGTGLHDLTLVAQQSSVLIKEPDGTMHLHCHIQDGEVIPC